MDAAAAPVETRYALSGDVHLAYQVVGHGPLDLVLVPGWVSNLEVAWEEPRHASFLRRLATFSRLILFDRRGTGLSDRGGGLATLEERMDDVRAVMDAAGARRAALFGYRGGGPMCLLFAATYPERTSALILFGSYAKRTWAPDYPWGPTPAEHEAFMDRIRRAWGTDLHAQLLAPSATGDEEFRRWWARYQRLSASPNAALAIARMNAEIDVRHVLGAIRVPTLVLHRSGDREIDAGGSRYLAERIPGAKYVELPGDDHLPFAGDRETILREVEVFLTGSLPVPDSNRVLATLLITGIVGAAANAARLGDQAWGEITRTYDALVREQLTRFHGKEIKPTISGFVATFDGPARAIRCASAIVDAARTLGLAARAGLHVGECEMTGGQIGGIALQIAERVFYRAGPGEVVVSSTVKDIVAGAGIEFNEIDTRLVTGPESGWTLYRVVQGARHPQEPGAVDLSDIDIPRSPTILSRREREVVILISRGLSNRQIADDLSISPATVERHVANIFAKLGFHSRARIAAWAVAHDLLRKEPREDA